MGKNLIIKGANFSVNAINSQTVLTIGYTEDIFNSANAIANISSAAFTDSRYANLYNKHINIIELKVAQAGAISVFGFKNDTLTLKTTLNFTKNMVDNVVQFPVSIYVEENEMICFASPDDTGKFYYYRSGSRYSFYTRIGFSGETPTLAENRSLCINIYTNG